VVEVDVMTAVEAVVEDSFQALLHFTTQQHIPLQLVAEVLHLQTNQQKV
jgi:hypothetical protein